MLKKRLITAAILLPLVILGILFLPAFYFMLASGLVFLAAAWEWTALAGFTSTKGRILGLLGISLLVSIIWLLKDSRLFLDNLFFIPFVIWLLAFVMVVIYPKGSRLYGSKGVSTVIGASILLLGFASILFLKVISPYLLLYPMILVWVADSGAFFAGRRFGKHKLAPQVSPGKTWEGVVGALLLSFCLAALAFYIAKHHIPISFSAWILLSLITVLFSIVGDLFESLFKRLRNLKDSGTLLPGHGGVLDRIDSLLAALPIFLSGFLLISRYIR